MQKNRETMAGPRSNSIREEPETSNRNLTPEVLILRRLVERPVTKQQTTHRNSLDRGIWDLNHTFETRDSIHFASIDSSRYKSPPAERTDDFRSLAMSLVDLLNECYAYKLFIHPSNVY